LNSVNIAVRFLVWTGVSQAWTFGATFYIIVVPFVEEVIKRTLEMWEGGYFLLKFCMFLLKMFNCLKKYEFVKF